MTLSDRAKRFSMTEATPGDDRPRIWVEGRQRPRFKLGAYAATAWGMAKRDLLPEMVEAEARLRGLGQRVAAGEVGVSMARAGRFVPSHQRVGAGLLGMAGLMAGARSLLAPPEEAAAPLAYPDLARARARIRPVVVASKTVEPTLHAIRSAISTAPEAPLREVVTEPGAGPSLVARSLLARSLRAAGCRVVLGVVVPFALVGGAVKAMLYHLNGGDLADWS